MDYAIFLRELTLTPRDWFLTPAGAIRYPADQDRGPMPLGDCPACPLNRLRGLHRFAGRDWFSVAIAADNCHGHDAQIRRDLLAACNLTET